MTTATRRTVLGLALVLVAALVAGVLGLHRIGLLPWGSQRDEPVAEAPAGAATRTPRCDTPALAGPAAPPDGAVTVPTGTPLTEVVDRHPGGTTYWLAPGTHRLPDGQYAQVVPQDGDTFLGAPGAVLDGQHVNRYAFGGHATGVTLRFLTVQNFGAPEDNNNEGVVNHDSAARWTVEASTVQGNAGAGVMLGSRNRVLGNCLRSNGQYGFNAYHRDGVRDITLEGNEITGNNTDDWERRQPGCGCTGGGKFWATVGAEVVGNYVHDNRGVGLWADNNNAGFRFEGNYVADNDAEGLMYETSYNAAIVNNTFARNAIVKGPLNPSFPAAAVYLSESGADPRLGGEHADALRVSGNYFVDNWSGVVGWENADRFAGSPANTSTGQAPLGNPRVATVEACSQSDNISEPPYVDDCRWKTQNLVVERNVFEFDPTRIPLCARVTGCGFNGLFSNYGTYPEWSPYKADVVGERVAFQQNNVWRSNTYHGDWQFVAEEVGNVVPWDTWRGAPYNQDAGSTLS